MQSTKIHNQQAKLALDYNELLKELMSHKMTSVGCYKIKETIGQGTFAKVKRGRHKITGRQVAIKRISKEHAPMITREIHHHKQINHPNIVTLYETITTESFIYIISEYCPNGDLLDALSASGGRCSNDRVRRWFHQLTDAINYCHSNQIIHRDLKLENILLDFNDNIKICDFSFARLAQKNQFLETFCGSLSYSAPEIISGKKYSGPETDIWSLGIILYTLLAGEFPFDDDSEIVTQKKILELDYQIPIFFSACLSNLIQGILQLNPLDRLNCTTIIQHPWMLQKEAESDPAFNIQKNEQFLFNALLSAGFDHDILIQMKSGKCDTKSTLWRHLLENMAEADKKPIETPIEPPRTLENKYTETFDQKAYPEPTIPLRIQTVGFGSTREKPAGWLSSVKSWFGSKPPEQNTTKFSFTVDQAPVYRSSGSQKYRRNVLQLSEPPVNELEQLNYKDTPRTIKMPVGILASPVLMPPTALTSRTLSETFVISGEHFQPKDMHQHYSQHTPPPSPPVTSNSPVTSPIDWQKEHLKKPVYLDLEKPQKKPLENTHEKQTNSLRSPRFEFTPRNQLGAYGEQRKPIASKTIIEEEEEY